MITVMHPLKWKWHIPPQLIEPVSPHGSEEVRVRKHHSADRCVHRPAVLAISGPCIAGGRPGALEDGREVDDILAEEERAADHEDQRHDDHPLDAEPRHCFVIRRLGCPDVAHWW